MIKLLLIISVVLLSACQQLQHGQTQPVIVKDYKNKIMYTSCSGAAENWASCYTKAKNTCENGYQLIDFKENANGGFRELNFKCK